MANNQCEEITDDAIETLQIILWNNKWETLVEKRILRIRGLISAKKKKRSN